MAQVRLILGALICAFILSACSSTNGNGFFKTMSQLLGGQPDKEVFKDSTVKEELEYQYRICKSEYEEHTEEMSLCVREAYEQIIEEKGIGERPEGGRVIIEEVDESDAINEEQQKSTGDEQ